MTADDPPLSVPSSVPESEPNSTRHPRSSRLGVVLPWLVILAVVALLMTRSDAPVESEGPNLVLELQGRIWVGAVALSAESKSMFRGQLAEFRGVGSIHDRAAVIVLLTELADVETARDEYFELSGAVRAGELDPPTKSEGELLDALEVLFEVGEPADNLANLRAGQRVILREQLGWLGELALHPVGTDEDAREVLLGDARRAAVVAAAGVSGLIFFSMAGLAAAFGLLLLFSSEKTRRHFRPGRLPAGRSIQTFAIWMGLFLAFQLAAAWIAQTAEVSRAFAGLAAFFLSLIALGWPILRGDTWSDVRSDFGLHLGGHPVKELLATATGYCVMFPLLMVGLFGTAILAAIAQKLREASGGEAMDLPSHPVVPAVAEGATVERVGFFLLAAVAAPIVEEVFFRGVLYRHLREISHRWGVFLSVTGSALIGCFIFAAVHPQGIVAIPALMGIAGGITVLREWRDTIVPGMIVHGLWNGVLFAGLLQIL